MSAFVEIIFDNTDNRFPTGKDEVVIRRTIGLKKDDYTLDKRGVSKADILNLLESAGFSRANPYYIVPQGRIVSLTNAKDAERLQLLKEVAGTQVYENRRQESQKIMDETHLKRVKIDELLVYIEERLQELEGEKAELRQYQQNDKERRCLEYALYNRELQRLSSLLEAIDEDRNVGLNAADEAHHELAERERRLEEIEAQTTELRQTIALLEVEHLERFAERDDLVSTRVAIELEIQNSNEMDTAEDDVPDIKQQIGEANGKLAKVREEIDSERTEEAQIQENLANCQRDYSLGLARKSRAGQFKSKTERDRFLSREIAQTKHVITEKSEQISRSDHELADLSNTRTLLAKEAGQLRAKIDGHGQDVNQIAREVELHEQNYKTLDYERRQLWREQAKVDTIIRTTQDELRSAENGLAKAMDRNTYRGISNVQRIVEQHKIQGVHGLLFELFNVSDRYRVPVEVTAGNSLFHVVVDTDEIASQVLELLNKEKEGRVTFMPLNRLKLKDVQFPNANDAIPLIKKLEYDTRFELAMQQV